MVPGAPAQQAWAIRCHGALGEVRGIGPLRLVRNSSLPLRVRLHGCLLCIYIHYTYFTSTCSEGSQTPTLPSHLPGRPPARLALPSPHAPPLAGAPMVPVSWQEMECPKTRAVEKRKVAKLSA